MANASAGTNPGPGKAREDLISDFRNLALHAQELMRATASASGEGVDAARERLLGSLRDVGDQIKEAQDFAIGQTRRAIQVTDTYVHERPWQAIAGALLVGLLLGAISAGRR